MAKFFVEPLAYPHTRERLWRRKEKHACLSNLEPGRQVTGELGSKATL